MIRQSISFTTPNDEWLNSLVESEEYSSKSEIVNDLIRKARSKKMQIEKIRAELIKGEQSGFIEMNNDETKARVKAEILAQSKEELRRDGLL